MKNFIILLNLLFFVGPALAQDFDVEKMDELFSTVEENNKGMGSFSLYQNGEEIYEESMGYADIANNVASEKNTRFRIGSISKTFTASLIMQLIEEGKLQLSTKLSEFYPDVPNAEEITVEDLLRHQSGLFNFTNDKAYLEYMEQPKTKEELLSIFREQEPVFEPGEKNEYSNTNYVLLSFVAEDITGKNFADLLKEKITAPLGLENTYYGGKINTANFEAQSYKKEKDWVLNTETDMSIPQGAGAIVSTPSDLNEFFTALFNGKVVTPESLEKMKTMQNGYGMGLFSYPYHDKEFYGHTGGIDGFNSVAGYLPEDDLAVSYISNATDLPINEVLIGALSIYYGMDYAIPVFETVEIPAEELEKFAGTYGSENFPLKIKVFTEGGALKAQATGQPQFPLEAYDQNKFQFSRAGLKMEFTPEEDKMLFMQAGGSYELYRE